MNKQSRDSLPDEAANPAGGPDDAQRPVTIGRVRSGDQKDKRFSRRKYTKKRR